VKLVRKDPPRHFLVGAAPQVEMKDCGMLALEADEQITLLTEGGAEYDVARKDWGFYATPSLNGRLEQFGLRGVLIRNRDSGRYFVLLIERGREGAFEAYCRKDNLAVVAWLDSTAALDSLARKLEK